MFLKLNLKYLKLIVLLVLIGFLKPTLFQRSWRRNFQLMKFESVSENSYEIVKLNS